MGNIALLKRAIPFFATFAFGLFVASFFVDMSNPHSDYHGRGRCHHDMWQMRIENEDLREENRQLRERLDVTHENEFETEGTSVYKNEDWVPPSVEEPVLPPPPPLPVKPHKAHVR